MSEVIQPVKEKKKENHKQRAYLNSITSILDYGGTQITGFIVSPFIVNGLGNSMYGIYQVLNQMSGYANMADTRASQVLKWTVAQKRDSASHEDLRNEMTTALVVTSLMLPIILLLGGVLVWYAPVITQAEERYYDLVRITASLMILSLVIYKVFDIFESLLRGMNLGFKGMGVRTGIIALGGALKVLAITQGYGLIGLSIVQVIISLITGLVFYFIVKKHVGWFGFGKTNKAKVISYSKVSGWFMGFSFSHMILLNSDKILLGYLVGPELVTIYVLTLFTVKSMEGVISAVISGIIPGIGKFFGNREFEKVRDARRVLTLIIWLSVSTIGVPILLFNQSFLYLWIGEGKFAGHMENLLLLFIGVQYIFFYMDSNFINVTLDMKTKVVLSTLSSLLTVLLAFVLVKEYLLIGLCLSILVGRLVLTIGYPIILKTKMEESFSLLKFGNIRPLMVSMGIFLLAVYFSDQILVESWIHLIGWGLLSALVSGFFFWVVGLSRNNKAEALSVITKINFLGKRKK